MMQARDDVAWSSKAAMEIARNVQILSEFWYFASRVKKTYR